MKGIYVRVLADSNYNEKSGKERIVGQAFMEAWVLEMKRT